MVFSNPLFSTSYFTCYQQKESGIESLADTPKIVTKKEKEPRTTNIF